MMMLTARIAALLTLAALAVLFASAGLFVQDTRGLDLHGTAAAAVHICSGLLACALAGHAWLRRTGVLAAVAAAALFGLTFLQAALGSHATLALHVSGSLVLTLLAAWITFWTFTSREDSPTRPPHRPTNGWRTS